MNWNPETAIDHMAAVQRAIDARGLNGTEARVRRGMREIVAAWQARDLDALTGAVAKLLAALVKNKPQPSRAG